MHFAGEPQVYPVCIQADVESSGTFVPTDTVTFPEAYHSQSLSLDYETYNVNQSDSQKFTCPGPAVVDFSSGGGVAAPAASSGVAAPAASSDTPVVSSVGNAEPVATPSPSANSGDPTDVANPPVRWSSIFQRSSHVFCFTRYSRFQPQCHSRWYWYWRSSKRIFD